MEAGCWMLVWRFESLPDSCSIFFLYGEPVTGIPQQCNVSSVDHEGVVLSNAMFLSGGGRHVDESIAH
jgi:hypothetical protein